MKVSLETLDVDVADDVLAAVDREVSERVTSSVFDGVRDLRLRLRSAKGVLLCVAAVGFAGGSLVTSTATSKRPLDAIVGALEGLPDRIDRMHRIEERPNASTPAESHAAVREELKKLLARA
jgi:hypothetical protein